MKTHKVLIYLVVFMVVGAALWLIGSIVVNNTCFIEVHRIEGIEPDQELARQVKDAWAAVSSKVMFFWIGAGALMGVVLFLIFGLWPAREHETDSVIAIATRSIPIPILKVLKSVAEYKIILWALLIGGVVGALMAWFIPSALDSPGTLVVNNIFVMLIIGFMQGALSTGLILPLSLMLVESKE